VRDAEDVAHQLAHPVLLHALRTGAGRVAPLVGGHRPVAGGGQRGELPVPLPRALRVAVEEDDDLAAVRSSGTGAEGEITDLDVDLPGHRPDSRLPRPLGPARGRPRGGSLRSPPLASPPMTDAPTIVAPS